MTDAAKPEVPAKRKPGGQPGNRNNLRHGCYSIGLLPKKLSNIERSVGKLRMTLEQETIAVRGSISVTEAAFINTACRWERLSQLAGNWLRTRHDEMSDADRLAYAKQSAEASERRDKCIRALRLDAAAEESWAQLYAKPQLLLGVDRTGDVQDAVVVEGSGKGENAAPVH